MTGYMSRKTVASVLQLALLFFWLEATACDSPLLTDARNRRHQKSSAATAQPAAAPRTRQ